MNPHWIGSTRAFRKCRNPPDVCRPTLDLPTYWLAGGSPRSTSSSLHQGPKDFSYRSVESGFAAPGHPPSLMTLEEDRALFQENERHKQGFAGRRFWRHGPDPLHDVQMPPLLSEGTRNKERARRKASLSCYLVKC